MSEVPENVRRLAKDVLCDLADEREASISESRPFWSSEKACELIANAILAERKRCTDIAKRESAKAVEIYPVGEPRGIAIAVADYIRNAINGGQP